MANTSSDSALGLIPGRRAAPVGFGGRMAPSLCGSNGEAPWDCFLVKVWRWPLVKVADVGEVERGVRPSSIAEVSGVCSVGPFDAMLKQ